MSSFNESVGLGYLKTNAIEFVKYPSHRFMPVLQDCSFTLPWTAWRMQKRLCWHISLLKVTVTYKQSYWRKYWYLIYSSRATDLKCWYILSTLGGTRKKKTTRGTTTLSLNYLDQKHLCQMLNLHCEMCLLAGPKNGRNNTFLQMEFYILCQWDFCVSKAIIFNVIDSNTFEVIKLMWDIWSCRFLAMFVSTAVWEKWGLKRLLCPWSVWPDARMASLRRQWDCCPKLFTLKIEL